MRDLWLHPYYFHSQHDAFLVFEKALRSFRVSSPTVNANAMWTFDESPSSQEMRILSEALLQVTEARLQEKINSSGPREKRPSDGPKGGKNKKDKDKDKTRDKDKPERKAACKAWDAGTCADAACKLFHGNNYKDIPAEFNEMAKGVKPQVCVAFAYHGRCGRSSGPSCKSIKGNVQLHTCAKCKFTKGKHDIKQGSCPN